MPEDMAGYIDDRYAEVGKRIALSEYGGGGNPFQHVEGKPDKIDWRRDRRPEEWQTRIHEIEWAAIRANPKLWGSFAWVMFDFASAGRNEGGTHALNDKGLVTRGRLTRKDAFRSDAAGHRDQSLLQLLRGRTDRKRTIPRPAATGRK